MFLRTAKGDKLRSARLSPCRMQNHVICLVFKGILKPNQHFPCSDFLSGSKILFCCVRFLYTYLTIHPPSSGQDPVPCFVQGAAVYVHIRYAVFVALTISEVFFMGIIRCFRLYRACFNLAGVPGLIACTKYLCGALKLEEMPAKSSDFSGSAVYE